jgi:hypothetical protein
MAIVGNPLSQINNADNVGQGINNLTTAFSNPQAWASGELMRAKTQEALAQAQSVAGMLDVHRQLADAQSGYYGANAKKAASETALLDLGLSDRQGVGSALQTSLNLSPQTANALAILGRASGDPSGANPHLMQNIRDGLATQVVLGNPGNDNAPYIAANIQGKPVPDSSAVSLGQATQKLYSKPENNGQLTYHDPRDTRFFNPSAVPNAGGMAPVPFPQTGGGAAISPSAGMPISAGANNPYYATAGGGYSSPNIAVAPMPGTNPSPRPVNPYVPYISGDPKLERTALADFAKDSGLGATKVNLAALQGMQHLEEAHPPSFLGWGDIPQGVVAGRLSQIFGNADGSPAQQFTKYSTQLGGGGGGLSGLMQASGAGNTDAYRATMAQTTPNQNLSYGANTAIIKNLIAQNKQALEEYNFAQRFIDGYVDNQGHRFSPGALEQVRGLMSEYHNDPRSYGGKISKAYGTSEMTPQITLEDFFKEKVDNYAIPVIDPNGNPGHIPQKNLQAALQNGYRLSQ